MNPKLLAFASVLAYRGTLHVAMKRAELHTTLHDLLCLRVPPLGASEALTGPKDLSAREPGLWR